MLACSSSHFVFTDSCVRRLWSSALPAILVLIYSISLIPLPTAFKRIFHLAASPWKDFLTLAEAEAYDSDGDVIHETEQTEYTLVVLPLVFTLFLTSVAMAEVVAWIVVATYSFAVLGHAEKISIWDVVCAVLMAVAWLYAAIKPVAHPKITPPYDLLALYVLLLAGQIVTVGGDLYDYDVFGSPLPSTLTLIAQSFNNLAIICLIVAVLTRPVGVPSARIDTNKIGKSVSADDYTPLWGWISFNWMTPLITYAKNATLVENDVPELSPTMRAKPLFSKFSEVKYVRKSLLRQLWATNAKDISLDFVLTYFSIIFKYAGPFFLKRIIDAIDSDPTLQNRSQAYIFAFLAFCSTLLAAETDLLHLWLGRRAAVRMRSELISAIYNKALKRRDLSGIVNKDGARKGKAGDETGENSKVKDDNEDDPKAGADVGKIINLMSADVWRLTFLVSGMYFIYGAPFEIIIAATFLYQLLGWSAFAGFTILLLAWPLNSYFARRAVRISKGSSAARDKRLSILNEIIGAIKLIKYFAWEDRWIQRALDARHYELKWLVKSRVNSVIFQLIWSTAPVLVAVLSFLVFVAQGNELTLGIAFTSIALFGMMREPLNVVPAWAVTVLQTYVAVQRIETFLNEEEVDGQVSSLKRTNGVGSSSRPPDRGEFGIQKATFRWNVVEDSKTQKSNDKSKQSGTNLFKYFAPLRDSVETTDGSSGTVVSDQESPQGAESNNVFELSDISIIFPDGELTVITGPTASGKTALLLALLGEMTLVQNGGEILMSKEPERVDEHGLMQSISYAAQTPWLQHRSIKDNILFGHHYDEARYKEVVECCTLDVDLKFLEDGDLTEIGVRGITLSGGQKARVALARAVYAPTKFVLLDDPLSAVDSHTARFLYDRLFMGPLMRHRTVILVTHHVELVLPGTHYLIRMLDGRINFQGTVKELRSQGLLDCVIEAKSEAKQESHEVPDAASGLKRADDEEQDSVEIEKEPDGTKQVIAKKPRKLIEDEERATGRVKWNIYKTYLKASSYWTWLILVAIVIIAQFVGFIEKYWIMVWGEAYGQGAQGMYTGELNSIQQQQLLLADGASLSSPFLNQPQPFITSGLRDKLPPAKEKPLFYVAVYALVGLVSVLVRVGSAIVQYTGALRASRNLFERLLNSVVHATFRWQDTTPSGRLLNRFSQDMETIDSSLGSSLQAVNSSLANFFSSAIVVIAVFPLFAIPATMFGYVYYYLAIGYLSTGTELRRLEAISRSPIFSDFGEVLEGVVTVRAFSAEGRFMNSLYKKVDLTLRMWYTFWMTNRWLLLRFDCLGALAVLITTLFALSGLVDAGWAALSITSTITFSTNIYWACRFFTQLELDLNSVERVVQYLDLPQEPPAIIEESRPPAHWPSSTGPDEDSLLVVENLTVRYAPELPAVLNGVTFSLKARERVGLLGRTGSGKSTLATSILHFVDPAEGRILIDGIDISKIGLHDLRSRLTFIPQDATLFSSTLRDNLDPFGEYTDDECLGALYRVHMLSEGAYQSQLSSRTVSEAPSIHSSQSEQLSTAVVEPSSSRAPSEISTATATTVTEGHDPESPKITLQSEVNAGGLNFSAGQRQLIAMARALLRQSTIIIFDEATSSIDFETDARIQAAIREEFGQSLLLTVAHRLRTVIDYDRLVVLDQGRVVEFDTPWKLINKEGGIFRGMCLRSGSYAELEKTAKTKAQDI